MPPVLVDAGPIIALLDRSDPHHERCIEALRTIRDPLLTTWPVITEAMYLLGFSWKAQAALWDLIDSQVLGIAPLGLADAARMRDLMEKYRDQPMDLADASLVRVAERERLRRILTLDRRHFVTYRPTRLGRFLVIP